MEDNSKTKQPAGKKYKRSTIFIKKKLQYYYMMLIVASVAIGFLIIGLEIAWNMSRIFSERPVLLGLFIDEARVILPMFLLKVTLYFILVILVASVISHRMAGPIYKFERSSNVVGSGDLTHKVFLRDGDQLTDLQVEFNQMIGNIGSKVKGDKKSAELALKQLDDILSKTTDNSMKQKLRQIRQNIAKVGAGFKI